MAKRRAKRGFDLGSGPGDPFSDGAIAGKAPSQRQQRVGENIRRALADILMRGESHDPELARHSITVSEVRCSPDLRHATVFVLPLGGRDEDAALAALDRNKGALRRLVSHAVTLKYAPELHFERDASFDRMDETRRLLERAEVRRDLGASQDRPEED